MIKLPFGSGAPASPFAREAETFKGILHDLAPELKLDYSAASIEGLEAFISQQFDPPGSKNVPDSLVIGVGCYVGEVIIRTLGGHWNKQGKPEINDMGQVDALFPVQKAAKRFKAGPGDALPFYYQTVARYALQKSK